MMTAVYDNPSTMHRECYQDGKLLYSYDISIFYSKDKIPSDLFFFGAKVGDWKTGQIIGDKEAIKGE